MTSTRHIMGMPITLEIVDNNIGAEVADEVFAYFKSINNKFSTYKPESEISQINLGKVSAADYSPEMRTIFALAEETKQLTNGYFDIKIKDGIYDPSGLVKGWAIHNAAKILVDKGLKNYYLVAGGDIQASGLNNNGKPWSVGIKNPFKKHELIKIIYITNQGVATSGTYEQGQHIYNPHNRTSLITDIVSLTVIGPNIFEADRFATAAFAMGPYGINFIEKLNGFEGYMIDENGLATKTSGFEKYTKF